MNEIHGERTARKAAELALRETEQRFSLLVDGVTDYAIYMLDPNGIVTSWNRGAQRIKGYRTEEIVGRHFSCFYTEEDRKANAPQQTLEIAARMVGLKPKLCACARTAATSWPTW
jgi:PAS domain-containing protein